MSRHRSTRRDFLKRTTAAACVGASVPYFWTSSQAGAQSANDRPVVAAIGVGGKGTGNGRAAARYADVAACCDVDRDHA